MSTENPTNVSTFYLAPNKYSICI